MQVNSNSNYPTECLPGSSSNSHRISTSSDGDIYEQDTIKTLTPPEEAKCNEQSVVQETNKPTVNDLQLKNTDGENKCDPGNFEEILETNTFILLNLNEPE